MTDPVQASVAYDWEHRRKWFYSPFPVEEYKRRTKALADWCKANGYDTALVHSSTGSRGELRYLANWDNFIGGDSVMIIPASGAEPTLVTNSIFHGEPMHAGAFTTWVPNMLAADHPGTVTHQVSLAGLIAKVLIDCGLAKARAALVGKAMPAVLRDELAAALPAFTFQPADGMFSQLKSVKSECEIEVLRKVARIGAKGLLAGYHAAKPGVTEKTVAGAVYGAMMEAGADEIPGPPAIVAGPRAGFKHVFPTDRRMALGDMVCLDIAALYGGYFADVARGFVVGDDPDDRLRHMLDTSLSMSEEVLKRIKAGVPISWVMDAAKEVAVEAGFGHLYHAKGFGHGIGTNKAELPKFAEGVPDTLKANMVFCLEPMLVETGVGTAVVEDMIRVTEEGYEILSEGCPRRLW